MDGWMDEWVDGWMDGWIYLDGDELMAMGDGWIDRVSSISKFEFRGVSRGSSCTAALSC